MGDAGAIGRACTGAEQAVAQELGFLEERHHLEKGDTVRRTREAKAAVATSL